MEEKELRAACAWNVKMLRRLKGPLRQVQDTTAIEETTGAGVGDDQLQKSVVPAQFRKVGLKNEQAHPLMDISIEAGLLDTLLFREKLTQKEKENLV
jgi:hypothetical protein